MKIRFLLEANLPPTFNAYARCHALQRAVGRACAAVADGARRAHAERGRSVFPVAGLNLRRTAQQCAREGGSRGGCGSNPAVTLRDDLVGVRVEIAKRQLVRKSVRPKKIFLRGGAQDEGGGKRCQGKLFQFFDLHQYYHRAPGKQKSGSGQSHRSAAAQGRTVAGKRIVGRWGVTPRRLRC